MHAQMSKAKKSKYLTKKTSFQGKEMTLYSIDGNIWSSRPWELEKIVERHEAERIKLDPTAVAEAAAEGEEAVAPLEAGADEEESDAPKKGAKGSKPAAKVKAPAKKAAKK